MNPAIMIQKASPRPASTASGINSANATMKAANNTLTARRFPTWSTLPRTRSISPTFTENSSSPCAN